MKKFTVLFTLFILCFQLSTAQKSPEEFLGYKIGTQYTRHANVVDYFRHVAENSNLVEYQQYGRTYEGRPLTYAVISSPENLANLEQIRKNHLASAGMDVDNPASQPEKAVVWLSYNVHGNEASSTEAAMLTLYELVTEKKDWLENVVVIIDPTVNPDGRDRYVNWYNQVKGEPYNTAPISMENMEPWPGGRPNHYLFDLNRDWAWASQVETRERLKVFNDWLPHIHVDFHEQGPAEPYYFAPAAEPLHEVITPFQRNFQTEIGKNHAKYFDEKGWLYFTRERFDLLYPSYGDTYPIYNGSIGMTYEQGGQVGLGFQTSEGYVLTLVDRVAHHFTTGISTVEVASQNVDKLNSEFEKFYDNSDMEVKSYALSGPADKIQALKELLDRHEIKYGNATKGKIRGYDYQNKKNNSVDASEDMLVINTDQPKGTLVRVLMEPSAKLTDSLTYDITAWSLPYAYGLKAVASNKKISSVEAPAPATVNNQANPSGAAYISKWNSMKDARYLTALLNEGIRVRFTETAMENGNQKFEPGSLVISKSDNPNVENFDQKVVELANEHNRQITSATTGFSTSGPDFGSSQVRVINKPRIAVLGGEGISSLNFGEIWYFFEQELKYPVTNIFANDLNRVDFSKLDVLILPNGNYNRIFEEEDLDKITSWVKGGGKVIAVGSAVSYFAGKEGFDLEEQKEVKKDSLQNGNLIPYAQREREDIKELITGSIIKTKVDKTHPLAFGYGDEYYSLKLSDASYPYLNEGYNVAYLGENPDIVSGFAGSKAKKKIKNSIVFAEEPMGKGSFVYLVDNPLFRAFWQNGKLFFVNSVFFVNNDRITN